MLTILTKTFNDLAVDELYAILRLRSAIFVVEQNCVYQDLDNKDQKALHVMAYQRGHLVAYARVFKSGDYFDTASIGRVMVKKEARQYKYGYAIMEAAIKVVETQFKESKITISAQSHLRHFYNKLGFVQQGEIYLEDGIPHQQMVRH